MIPMHINFLEALVILHLCQRIFPDQKKNFSNDYSVNDYNDC